MNKIRLGLMGYGNITRGIQANIHAFPDMEICAIFSRRPLGDISNNYPIYNQSQIGEFCGKIDVMIICLGSATDMPRFSPSILRLFNTVDSFDTHSKIPDYFKSMDRAGKQSGRLGLVSAGWDPGLFSLSRMMFQSFLPTGKDYTFWGEGISQGHSDALRRIDGVIDARQYTLPSADALKIVRSGGTPALKATDMHTRVCFVAADNNADKARIEAEIRAMPGYFKGYATTINFVSPDEIKQNHSRLPHGGVVIRSGHTQPHNKQLLELSVRLDSNPEFTAGILLCYARAVMRMNKEGKCGAVSVFDVPPAYLSLKDDDELRASLL